MYKMVAYSSSQHELRVGCEEGDKVENECYNKDKHIN